MSLPATSRPRRSLAPGGAWSAEIEIKRSRFLTELRHVTSEEEARALIAEARSRYPDARHHCSAFILHGEGAINVERSSDDGEPAGTAGTPMLEVLRGAGLSDVAVVVTRYFGGILLGTGGLVRAYSDAVRAALAQAKCVEWEIRQLAELEATFAVAGRYEAELRARNVEIVDVCYTDRATFRLAIAPTQVARIADTVASLSGGTSQLRLTGTDWRPRL